MKRNGDVISLRVPSMITQGMKQTSPYAARKWLRNMKAYIESVPGGRAILDDPSRIFNADETGFALDANTGACTRVIAEKGVKHVNKKKVS